MSTESSGQLRALAVKSAAWYGGTRLWGQLLSWIITIVLARLLVPADYGLFAMAYTMLTVLELLQEFGLGTAIVQRKDLTTRQLNGIFWTVVGASLLLTTLTFVGADAISGFYGEPKLPWVLRVLCLTFLVNSMGIVPYNLLSKALDLRHRSIAEVLGTATKTLITLALAYEGLGVWALVFGHLARSVVLNGALLMFAGWVPGLELAREGMGGVLTFGLRIAGMHLVGNSSPAITTLIIGRVLGGAAVGLYTMALSLSEAPHRITTAILNEVSFPVFSKLQDEREQLSVYFLKISKYLAVISLPAQVGLAVVAPDLIPLLLSSRWDGVVAPFRIICMESAVIVTTLTASSMLTALGRANFLLGRSFLSVGCMIVATLIGAPFGLAGVATARLILAVPVRLSSLLPCLWALRLPVRRYLGILISPVLSASLMAVVVLTVRRVLLPDAAPLERLVVSAMAGGVTYGAALVLLDRGLVGEVGSIARDLVSRSKA